MEWRTPTNNGGWRCSAQNSVCGDCTCTCSGPYPCTVGPTFVVCPSSDRNDPEDPEEETVAQRRTRLTKRARDWKKRVRWSDMTPVLPVRPRVRVVAPGYRLFG